MVVVTAVGQQVEDARRVAQPAQQRRGEQRPIEAVAAALAQHRQRAAIALFAAVGDVVEKGLDLGRGAEAADLLTFGGGKRLEEISKGVRGH